AGCGSGFSDDEYQGAGAEILDSAPDIFSRAEMIMKVKEPVDEEFRMIRKDQLVFTYFHFASNEPLTRAMIDSGAVCLSYEPVGNTAGCLALLLPVSGAAGRRAIQEGAKSLEKPLQRRGIQLGRVPGVRPARLLVLGRGVVGTNAAKTPAGMAADLIVVDVNL